MATALQTKLNEITQHAMIGASLALGMKLGLFDALAAVASEQEPKCAAAVAETAACKPRYVKEWLSCMACAGIIEVTEDEKFYIKQENLKDLVGDAKADSLSVVMMLPGFMKNYDALAGVFKKDGPLGLDYSDFGDFYESMQSWSEAMHAKHLIGDILPLVDASLPGRLADGVATSLDVGCGAGFHSAMLAEAYPKAQFVGIDITHEAIDMAKQKKTSSGAAFENLEFRQMNAGKMAADWNDKFDFVSIFDACHDQMRPDLCLAEVYRVLKPGGLFMMLEINGTSSTKKDRELMGCHASMMYSLSTFHCLAVGSNSEDAVCAGAMWGSKVATDMLKSVGFTDITTHTPDYLPVNIVYVCRK